MLEQMANQQHKVTIGVLGQNKFVFPYPTDPVKIGRLKFFYWKFAVTFFSFFFSFRSKFVLLKMSYFRFVSPKDRYFRITETSLSSKKKIPTYLPTSKIVGGVRGNRNIFNCGLTFDSHLLLSSEKIIPFHSLLNITY